MKTQYFFFFKFYLFIWERERGRVSASEREHISEKVSTSGGRGRERERSGSPLSREPNQKKRSSIPEPWDHDLSQRQTDTTDWAPQALQKSSIFYAFLELVHIKLQVKFLSKPYASIYLETPNLCYTPMWLYKLTITLYFLISFNIFILKREIG